ncbi:unnamed protein product [Caenorhabditis nigoni]
MSAKIRNFDDDVAKKFSDVVLMAGNKKFYVSKKYLSSHSTYFESLFEEESQKSIIKLKNIDPANFQKFLEVLYGESVINDDNLEGILKLADMFKARTAIRRSEEFMNINIWKGSMEGYYPDRLSVECLGTPNTYWEIRLETYVKIMKTNGQWQRTSSSYPHSLYDPFHKANIFSADCSENYLFDGKLTIELEVEIKDIVGIEKISKLRNFDDDVAKKFSDFYFVVGNKEFHICKNYLSSHSTVFESLFFVKFADSKSLRFNNRDPKDFQKFLEVLYGEPAIDDVSVDRILKIAEYFKAKTVIKRCEEFLLEKSKISRKRKFASAVKYDLGTLKKKCLSEVNTTGEIRELAPENAEDFKPNVWKELFSKALLSR